MVLMNNVNLHKFSLYLNYLYRVVQTLSLKNFSHREQEIKEVDIKTTKRHSPYYNFYHV